MDVDYPTIYNHKMLRGKMNREYDKIKLFTIIIALMLLSAGIGNQIANASSERELICKETCVSYDNWTEPHVRSRVRDNRCLCKFTGSYNYKDIGEISIIITN